MSWTHVYVVYRINPQGGLDEVFQHNELSKANYWLRYIALPGDVLCRTPLHPKHPKTTMLPEYMSHKATSGSVTSDKKTWEKNAAQHNFNGSFPERQMGGEGVTSAETASSGARG